MTMNRANVIDVGSENDEGDFSFGIEWSSSSDLLADFENDSLGDTLMCSIIEPQDSILPADSSTPKLAKNSTNQVPLQQRFAKVAINEVEKRVVNNSPEKTRQQNRWALNVWKSWAEWRSKKVNTNGENYGAVPSDIVKCRSVEEMGHWLTYFILEVRRKDGKPYPPKSLYEICVGLQRHIRSFSSHCNITIIDEKNPAFNQFYNVLDSRMKELSAQGVGIEVKQAEEITVDEENQLWESRVINFDNAQGLSYGVFFIIVNFSDCEHGMSMRIWIVTK